MMGVVGVDVQSISSNATLWAKQNTTEFVGMHIDVAVRGVFLFVAILEIVVGVAGNSLLLSVLVTQRSLLMRSLHNIFIANLAFSDLVCVGYWMSFFVLDLLLGHHPVLNNTHCIVNAFIIYLCTAVAVLSLMSISLNRYLHVCHSRLYIRVFTKGRTITWSLMTWFIGALVVLPPQLNVGMYGYNRVNHMCTSVDRSQSEFFKTAVVVFCLVPVLSIGYWNMAIFCYWKKHHLDVNTKYQLAPGTTDNCSFLAGLCCVIHKNKARLEEEERGRNLHDDNALVNDRENLDTKQEKHADLVPVSGDIEDTKPALTGSLQPTTAVPADQSFEEIPPENASVLSSAEKENHQDRKRSDASTAGHQTTTLQILYRRLQKERARERAFVRSLCVVFALMVISFIPYGVNTMATPSTGPESPEVAISMTLLLMFSCSVNWIVYGVMNRSFRRAYVTYVQRVVSTCCRCFGMDVVRKDEGRDSSD